MKAVMYGAGNIGRGFIQAVMRDREERGIFTSLHDFCRFRTW